MSVAVHDLSVRYGAKQVLNDVAMRAESGHLTAIVGPNGSGKSTLVKAICGDLPYDGTVTLNGLDIARTKPWTLAAMRGVLPQVSTLAFPFHAIEVVRIGLSAGIGAVQAGRAEAALARVGLAGYANRYYQELSGGEQQRVHLARVLAQVWEPRTETGPRWLILDEPVSSLDIAHQLQVMEIARDFARAGGGVLAVMHDLNLTALFADCMILMAGGAIEAVGAPDEVMTDALLSDAYGCPLRVSTPPRQAAPYILPHAAL
ncbi:MAG: heme ABC transporter ATP-binding protein [Pseudomonadota bacterium]